MTVTKWSFCALFVWVMGLSMEGPCYCRFHHQSSFFATAFVADRRSTTKNHRLLVRGVRNNHPLWDTAVAVDDDDHHHRERDDSAQQELEKRRQKTIVDFSNSVETSIHDQSFRSLVLRGKKKKRKRTNSKSSNNDELRGSIRQVQGRLVELPKARNKKGQESNMHLQLTIKYHGATDIASNVKPTHVSETLQNLLSKETADEKNDGTTKSDSTILMVSSEWGADAAANSIQGAELITSQHTFDLQLTSSSPKLIRRKTKKDEQRQQQSSVTSHDRTKQVPLSNQEDFFHALGVTNANDGKPRPGMKSKLRQCQKFVEIVSGLVSKAVVSTDDNDVPFTIKVLDMGCGRGYLTFALHAFLYKEYASKNKNNVVHSCGIDFRPKLVQEISGIARSLGDRFEGLTFETGTIEDTMRKQQEDRIETSGSLISKSCKVVIALHACDTATDDALWTGIQRQSDVIVVAPCCHKQLRRQLNEYLSSNNQQDPHVMSDVLRHGVYRERISETITDSLRALLLEWAGYRVQVFEFIGGEHTSKNVMITAIKNNNRRGGDSPQASAIEDRIRALSEMYGIKEQKLATRMGIHLRATTGNSSFRRTATGMPPL